MADAKKKEKLSLQFALTCASGAVVIVGLTTLIGSLSIGDAFTMMSGQGGSGLYDRMADTSIYKPMKILMLGIPGAILGGFLGYITGDIFDNPRGHIPEWYLERRKAKKEKKPEAPMITGEEMFLDDLNDELDAALSDALGEDPFK